MRSPLDSFGIFFQPLGMGQLFGVPERLLVDNFHAGIDVLGGRISQLWERMAGQKCFHARSRMIDQNLMGAALRAPAVMASARRIFRQRGATPVGTLAQQMSLSVRQYERRFVDEIGITPKLFARIARYQKAMDAKLTTPALSWLTIAHEFGYHDQMHMIKDFQKPSGDSPCGIISQPGDMRPDALVSSVV